MNPSLSTLERNNFHSISEGFQVTTTFAEVLTHLSPVENSSRRLYRQMLTDRWRW